MFPTGIFAGVFQEPRPDTPAASPAPGARQTQSFALTANPAGARPATPTPEEAAALAQAEAQYTDLRVALAAAAIGAALGAWVEWSTK